MRGGYLHNKVLLTPVITHLRALGAGVALEQPVKVGTRSGAVDIVADLGSRRLAVEVENSCRRVAWDIEKARALKAADLLIVAPTAGVAQACRREARRKVAVEGFSGLGIYILTLPLAHQWLSNCFRLISPPIEASASKTFPRETANSPSTPDRRL